MLSSVLPSCQCQSGYESNRIITQTTRAAPVHIILHSAEHFKVIQNPGITSTARAHPEQVILRELLPPADQILLSQIRATQQFDDYYDHTAFHQIYHEAKDAYLQIAIAVPAFAYASTVQHPRSTARIHINSCRHTTSLPSWTSFAYIFAQVRTPEEVTDESSELIEEMTSWATQIIIEMLIDMIPVALHDKDA
eukprot:6028117-Amphidinium_carterae.1